MSRKVHRHIASSVCLPPDIFCRVRARQSSFLLLLAMVALLIFPVISRAATDNDQKQQLETGIKKYWINIRRLQQGIRLQQEEMEHTLSQERDLLTELENIDTRLQEHHEKLGVLQGRMAAQQGLIAVKEKELARVNANKYMVQLHLQKRLSAYYKMGRIGLINVAFSAHTLPELLSFHDSFQTLIRYDQNLIETYRHSIGGLERVKEALTLERTLLQEFISQEEEAQKQVDTTKREKENLLTLIRTQKKLHELAITEMEKAGRTLSSHINVMEKKEEILEQGFLLNKGKLLPPVIGTLITRFNQENTNKMGITGKSKGIAITAPNGTRVKAIFNGTILFSGYLKGYGNTVIVDHGYQYYSIISRVEQLLKNKGDQVKTGESIALMGDTATLIDEGLYVEIRHGSVSLDPLQWLDTTKISMGKSQNQASPAAE
jgi:murein hydrolase activator